MVLRDKIYTVEEFWQIARLPENEGRRLELEEGVIHEMPASSPLNTVVAGRIIHFLNAFVIPRGLGYVTSPDGGFKLSEGRARQPDAAFISKARLPQLPREFNLAPDLAVEVVSPAEDIFRKAYEYLRAGTRLVWAVYTDEKIVYVLRLDADGGLYSKPFDLESTLSGGEVLPGFSLPVREIFPDQ